MKIVFNELSLASKRTKDVHLARIWMRDLLETLKIAKQMACDQTFVVLTSPDLRDMEIMKEYYVHEWLKDLDPGTRATFLTYFAIFAHLANHSHLFEFKYLKKVRSIGLGIAHLENCIAISIPSRPRWNKHSLEIDKHELTTHGHMKPTVTCTIRHACFSSHMELHRLKWKQIKKHCPNVGWGTIMPLSDDIAQNILNCSVQITGQSQRYGFYDGQFYEFQYDNSDTYHGYPIKLQDLRQAGVLRDILDLMLQQELINQTEYNDYVK